tara:strand:- start:551 stop:700 length:150 start_codon:yes stop_codon:yes gene_type:complete
MKTEFTNESIEFLIETIKKQEEEIKILKEAIEETKNTAIYYSKNNIKIH